MPTVVRNHARRNLSARSGLRLEPAYRVAVRGVSGNNRSGEVTARRSLVPPSDAPTTMPTLRRSWHPGTPGRPPTPAPCRGARPTPATAPTRAGPSPLSQARRGPAARRSRPPTLRQWALSFVVWVGAGREGVDLVAGTRAHPLVAVPHAVGAGADGGDPVGVVEVAAGVLTQLPAPPGHAALAVRRQSLAVLVLVPIFVLVDLDLDVRGDLVALGIVTGGHQNSTNCTASRRTRKRRARRTLRRFGSGTRRRANRPRVSRRSRSGYQRWG
jgi:hypothetical protein